MGARTERDGEGGRQSMAQHGGHVDLVRGEHPLDLQPVHQGDDLHGEDVRVGARDELGVGSEGGEGLVQAGAEAGVPLLEVVVRRVGGVAGLGRQHREQVDDLRLGGIVLDNGQQSLQHGAAIVRGGHAGRQT